MTGPPTPPAAPAALRPGISDFRRGRAGVHVVMPSLGDLVRDWHRGAQAVARGDWDYALRLFSSVPEPSARMRFNVGCVHLLAGDPEAALRVSQGPDSLHPRGWSQRPHPWGTLPSGPGGVDEGWDKVPAAGVSPGPLPFLPDGHLRMSPQVRLSEHLSRGGLCGQGTPAELSQGRDGGAGLWLCLHCVVTMCQALQFWGTAGMNTGSGALGRGANIPANRLEAGWGWEGAPRV